MGIGDELMMAGEARRRALARPGTRYLMRDKRGAPKWHFAWEGNPHIARPGEPHDGEITHVNGMRPYMAAYSHVQYQFRAYEPMPAALELPARVRELAKAAAGAVVFNPTVKLRAPVNKDWGVARWKALIARARAVRWIQIGESGGPRVRGAECVVTPDFWEACAVIAGARAVVCHEGALHHAAAALGVPAIVIRGGFISPRVTGYAGQVDFYIEDPRWPLGCGMRVPCAHCQAAMDAITPDAVAKALGALLEERKVAA